MGLRPIPAKWFELLVLRDDLTEAVDILAKSASVELESCGKPGPSPILAGCSQLLDRFDELERRYRPFWPAHAERKADKRCEPHVMLERAIHNLQSWAAEAEDQILELELLRKRNDELTLLLEIIRDADEWQPVLRDLANAGPLLRTGIYRLTSEQRPVIQNTFLIAERLNTSHNQFLIVVGLPNEVLALEQQLQLQQAHPLHLPTDLTSDAEQAEQSTAARLRETKLGIEAVNQRLESLQTKHGVARAIADVDFIRWYVENVPKLASTENFAWVTGWTSAPSNNALLQLLADADIKGLLRLSVAPDGSSPPLLLQNPRWLQPFEVFTGMLGVPGTGDADPTRIVAIFGPLMFGYMFGDIGQGAVLMIAGLILSRWYPLLRLLIAGGAMSMLFGWLFGSVFALETIVEPAWVHPITRPLQILVIPMLAGAVLLLIGMSLDALQAYWHQLGRRWWATGAGLAVCYLGLLGSVADPSLLLIAAAGCAWFILGSSIMAAQRRLAAAGHATIEFLETLLQLIVNTISFVRVGAFALAHAGLSLAVVGIAEGATSPLGKLVILVLGNALMIILECLVVGIQTTRLVLFEFFVRFLHAEGRPFKPIVPSTTISLFRNRRQA